METLADAVIEAVLYISMAPNDEEREDADVAALESLVGLLQDSSDEEREALCAALRRIRSAASKNRRDDPDFLASLRAIETDVLGDEEEGV